MRISYTVLDKLKNLTNKEMDFILYIAKLQNLKGEVQGVHHLEACRVCGMSKQTFYNLLDSLQKRDIISVTKSTDCDYDITIKDNNYQLPSGAYNQKKPYVSLHKYFTHLVAFKNLKANEKYLLFCILKVAFKKGRVFKISLLTFFANYCKELGLALRTVRGYLSKLKTFFVVNRHRGIYHIAAKPIMEETEAEKVELQSNRQLVQTYARRVKLHSTDESKESVAKLITQYRSIAKSAGYDIFSIIKLCIERSKETQEELNEKYIHKLVRGVLEL